MLSIRGSMLVLALLAVMLPGYLKAASKVEFDEDHPNMFVFLDMKVVEKGGYFGFCKKPPKFVCSDSLKFEKYVGKRGYFVSMDPVRTVLKMKTREVILETGGRYYFSYSLSRNYDDTRRLRSMLGLGVVFVEKEPAEPEPFESYPIVPQSSVFVIRSEVVNSGTRTRYYVDNGQPFWDTELEAVQGLLSSLGSREFDEEIVALLQGCFTQWDRIEQRYIIKASIDIIAGHRRGPVRASITATNSGISLYDEFHYESSEWLFVDRYVVVAGDTRYESPSLAFKRDHSGDKVWEWARQAVNTERRALLEAVASNNDAIVRFYGKDYYADSLVNDRQREVLRQMLRLHDLLSDLSVPK